MHGSSLRIGVVAGELSGDRLGAALIEAVRARYPDAEFEGMAGPLMRQAGCRAVWHAEEISIMGVVEVLAQLPRLLRLRKAVIRHFLQQPPDVFVGIDSPDFNLGIEKKLKQRGIPTIHWVSPSVWAWRTYRVRKIRNSVDTMMTLFPFEAEFYRRYGVSAQCVGHPLADEIPLHGDRQRARKALALDGETPCIALLPGSRDSEVSRLLPLFLATAALCQRALNSVQFVLPVAVPQLLPLYRRWLDSPAYRSLPVTLVQGRAREAMESADVVLLASGTAALECMLVKRPMVVAYRLHPLSYLLVKRLLHVDYVSLPNHLLGKPQVPEYLQSAARPELLSQAVLDLLRNRGQAERQTAPFQAVHEGLRTNAAQQAASIVLNRGIA